MGNPPEGFQDRSIPRGFHGSEDPQRFFKIGVSREDFQDRSVRGGFSKSESVEGVERYLGLPKTFSTSRSPCRFCANRAFRKMAFSLQSRNGKKLEL